MKVLCSLFLALTMSLSAPSSDVVTGIVVVHKGKQKSAAIINDKIYYEGEKFGKVKIENITTKGVKLSDGRLLKLKAR